MFRLIRKGVQAFMSCRDFVCNTWFYYMDRGYSFRNAIDLARKTMPN